MCFSATASFSSSILLVAIGTASLKTIRRKREIMLAGFPLLFALHQSNEGLLWLTLNSGNHPVAQKYLTLSYLLIAFFVWPVYSPLSIYFVEENAIRRKIIIPFIFLGTSLGTYLIFNLISNPHSALVINCSIYYDFILPTSEIVAAVLYLVAVFGTAVVSSQKSIVQIGIINIIFCALSAIVYYKVFISVWCFFAALLSIIIYLHFRSLENSSNRKPA